MYALARTTNNIQFNLLFNYLIKNKLQYVKTNALMFFENNLILYFQVNICCFKDNKKNNDIKSICMLSLNNFFMCFIDFHTVSLRIVLIAMFLLWFIKMVI